MLTDAQIRKAKAAEKPHKLTDGGGLYVYVTPAGGKLWRLRYRFNGKERTLSIGPYPSIGLGEARGAREAAKAALREGRDPSSERKRRRLDGAREAEQTFESIAREWFALQRGSWTATHAGDVIGSLERDVFPAIGAVPIKEISAPDVLSLLRSIEARPAIETARRVRQRISAVFVFAIASGRASSDPAAIVKGALAPLRKGRQPAITDLDEACKMLTEAEAETAHPVTKLALRILALTAVRPGTLATTPWAEWAALDAHEPTWQIPAERLKLRLEHKDDNARDHLAPLSRQAVEAIDALRTLTGGGPLAFPNTRRADRPISENAIGYLLNRAGYHARHVPHGWRATFSTVMNERFPVDRRVIDLMLAHVPKDRVEGAYNRAAHMTRRRELAQAWADLLLKDARPAAELLVGPRR